MVEASIAKRLNLREEAEMKIRNELVNGIFSLTLDEMKMLSVFVAHIPKDANSFDKFSVSASQLGLAMGISQDKSYQVIKTTALKLLTRTLLYQWKEPGARKASWVGCKWFDYIAYKDDTGTVEFQLYKALSRVLLNVCNAYVRQLPSELMPFKSLYSWRFVMIFRQWQKLGKCNYSLDELKKMLGVEDKYKKFTRNFIVKAIQPAVEEVNSLTDLFVSYDLIKTGRKYTHIQFKIVSKVKKLDKQAKKDQDIQKQLKKAEEIKKKLLGKKEEFTPSTAAETSKENQDQVKEAEKVQPKKTRRVLKGYLKLQDDDLFLMLNNGKFQQLSCGLVLEIKYQGKWTEARLEISNNQWYILVFSKVQAKLVIQDNNSYTTLVADGGEKWRVKNIKELSKIEIKPIKDYL